MFGLKLQYKLDQVTNYYFMEETHDYQLQMMALA